MRFSTVPARASWYPSAKGGAPVDPTPNSSSSARSLTSAATSAVRSARSVAYRFLSAFPFPKPLRPSPHPPLLPSPLDSELNSSSTTSPGLPSKVSTAALSQNSE